MWQRLLDLTILVGEWCLDRLDRLVGKASRLGDPVFFEREDFPWASTLERAAPIIRRELDGALAHRDQLPNFQDISTDQATITTDDRWKTYFLYGFGFRSDPNCERCPETARLVEAVPGMKTAMFSILAPGKHIPEHCGPYKGVVRYHLALKVPCDRERCRIRVANQVVAWTEGQSLIFDDTYEHEVWNDTDEERVVLFLDVVRPLRFPMNLVNDVVLRVIAHSPFVHDARRRQRRWEREFSQHLITTRSRPALLATRPGHRRDATFRSSSAE